MSPDDIPIWALVQEKVKADCLWRIPQKGIVAKLYNSNSPLHSLITWFLICCTPRSPPPQCLPAAPPRRPDPSAELESGCFSSCGSQAEGVLLQESLGRSSVHEVESSPCAAGQAFCPVAITAGSLGHGCRSRGWEAEDGAAP